MKFPFIIHMESLGGDLWLSKREKQALTAAESASGMRTENEEK